MTLLARCCLISMLAALSACAGLRTPDLLSEASPAAPSSPCSLSAVAASQDGLRSTQSCVEALIATYVAHARDLDEQRMGYDVALIGLLGATAGAELFNAHRDVSKALGLASATIGTGKNYSNSAQAAAALRGGAARLQCALRETAKLQQAAQNYVSGYDAMRAARARGPQAREDLDFLLQSCQATTAYHYSRYAGANPSTVDTGKLAQRLHAVASDISARTVDAFVGTRGSETDFSSKFEALAKKFQAAEQQAQVMQGAAKAAERSGHAQAAEAAEAMLPAVRDAAVAELTLEACAEL